MTVVIRESKETQIRCELNAGSGTARVSTGDAFLDHMLTAFARYSGVDLDVQATGDLRHHLIEDVAITLGVAFRGIVTPTAARYGHRVIPMDEALVEAAIDIGGRASYHGPIPSSLYDHFMQSFALHSASTLHLRVLRGSDRHHVVEAAFKALGLSVRDALVEGSAVFSTKGSVALHDAAPDTHA